MPTTHRTLTTAREIEAYLHRTRMAILECLRPAPATTSQVAARLGVHPANLTRHFRILEAAGLIALVEKRDTGRNLEKYYAAAADAFDVVPGPGALGAGHRIELAFLHSDLSVALASLPQDDPRSVTAALATARIRPEEFAGFASRLMALIEAFKEADSDGGEGYHLSVSLYPGSPPHSGSAPIRIGDDAHRG